MHWDSDKVMSVLQVSVTPSTADSPSINAGRTNLPPRQGTAVTQPGADTQPVTRFILMLHTSRRQRVELEVSPPNGKRTSIAKVLAKTSKSMSNTRLTSRKYFVHGFDQYIALTVCTFPWPTRQLEWDAIIIKPRVDSIGAILQLECECASPAR